MDEVVKAMAQQISDAFTRQIFGAYANPPASDIRADLDRISALLSRPVPVAIWFIDRPCEYRQVLEAVVSEETKRVGVGYLGHPGMPLYQWTLAELEEMIKELGTKGCDEALVKELFPFRLPGVWVQMCNAPHTLLVTEAELNEVKKQLEERKK